MMYWDVLPPFPPRRNRSSRRPGASDSLWAEGIKAPFLGSRRAPPLFPYMSSWQRNGFVQLIRRGSNLAVNVGGNPAELNLPLLFFSAGERRCG